MVKIKIVTDNYEKAGFGTIFMREVLGRMLCGLTMNIGYLLVFFNDQKKGLHDKIAGTIVVQKATDLAGMAEYSAGPAATPAYEPAPPAWEPAPAPSTAIDAELNAPLPPEAQPVVEPPPLFAEIPTHPVTPPASPVIEDPPTPMTPIPLDPAPEATAPPLFDPPATSVPPPPPDSPLQVETPVEPEPTAPALDFEAEARCPMCKSPLETQNPDKCNVCGYVVDQKQVVETQVPPEEITTGEATVVVTAPQLVTYSPEGQKEVYTLHLPITKIGRLKDNHLAFPNEKAVSGHHCVIYMEHNQFHIRDLNSTNGIYVNNKKVEDSPLADNDKIKLGFKVFKFQL